MRSRCHAQTQDFTVIDRDFLTLLAATVVAALLPLLEKVAARGFEKLGEGTAGTLFEKLKKRLTGASAQEALDKLAKEPARASAQQAVQSKVLEALEDDPAFADDLKRWLAEANAGGTTQTANVQGNENVTVQISGSSGSSVSVQR